MRSEAALFLLTLFFCLPTSSAAEDTACTCTEAEQVRRFVTQDPLDYIYMEDQPWQFLYCKANGDIVVALLGNDHPLLDDYVMPADGHSLIHVGDEDRWIRFEDFTKSANYFCAGKEGA